MAIYALDENDEYSFYSGNSQTSYIYSAGEGVSTDVKNIYLPNNTASSYSVAKLADVFHDSITESLYMVVGICFKKLCDQFFVIIGFNH